MSSVGSDIRSGVREVAITVLKLFMVYTALMVMCLIAARMFGGAVGYDVDLIGVVSESFQYLIPLIPLVVFAFVYGSIHPGSKVRLAVRLLSAAYLAVAIVFVTGEISYSLHDVVVDDVSGTYLDRISLDVDIDSYGYILLLVPVLSVADSVMELIQHRRSED